MTVGVQSMADPTWRDGQRAASRDGNIGHVAQAQTSYYRNSHRRPVALLPADQGHEPEDHRLGHVPGPRLRRRPSGEPLGPKHAVRPGRLRPVALLLALRRRHVHRPVRPPDDAHDRGDGRALPGPRRRRRRHLPRIRRPRRAGRGHRRRRLRRRLPAPHHGDDDQRLPDRGSDPRPARHDQVRRQRRLHEGFDDDPAGRAPAARRRPKTARRRPSSSTCEHAEGRQRRHRRRCGRTSSSASAAASARRCSTPELGAAAFTTVNMGVQSYREGKVLFWDKEQRKAGRRPTRAGRRAGKPQQEARQAEPDHRLDRAATPAARWTPPDYQKLAGPWIDGKDPAETTSSTSGQSRCSADAS